jgi:hypothetical protein
MSSIYKLPPAQYNTPESFDERYGARIAAAKAWLGPKYLTVPLHKKGA